MLALLKRAKLVRGTLPLVLAMDNGPENDNELVRSYLRVERVIVLWNVPYTPGSETPAARHFARRVIPRCDRAELVP